jgi:hypothetical protein
MDGAMAAQPVPEAAEPVEAAEQPGASGTATGRRLTPEQRERWLREVHRSAIEDDYPDPAKWLDAPSGSSGSPAAAADPASTVAAAGIFSSRSLRRGRRGRLLPCRRFEVAGTAQPGDPPEFLFVFALSGADFERLNAIKLSPRYLPGKGDTDQQIAAKTQAGLARCMAAQVALVCYEDDERRRPCFEIDRTGDAAADLMRATDEIQEELPFAVIRDICALSDGLIAGSEVLGEGLKGFFSDAQTFCAILSSALASWEDCPPGLIEQARAFGSVVSRVSSLGKWETRGAS